MLSITKNKSKRSTASVKFSSKPKPPPVQAYIPVPLQTYVPPSQSSQGVQSRLTESTFRTYLNGYVQITPIDLFRHVGNRVRYAIDTVYGERIVSTQYRLGGVVKYVSPDATFATMYNPYLRKSWNVSLIVPRNKRLRLYAFSKSADLVHKIRTGQSVV